MRVLLTGATGLIGSAVLAGLRSAGHEVVAVVHNSGDTHRLPWAEKCVALDIAGAHDAATWLPHLSGVDAVVNCAGVLQDSLRDSTAGVHADGPAALFAACEQAGVRRVVQISTVGADRGAPTAFTRTKRAGDEALMRHDLAWVILRPSVVVGRAAYGGSALFRGLAGLPVLPLIAEAGPLQVVQLDDVVRTVLFFLRPDAPAQISLDIVGPERLSLYRVLIAYRRWLGRENVYLWEVPRWLSAIAFRLGDLAGLLGWRPPVRSTLRRELVRGGVGDPARWMRITGMVPRALEDALAAEPASVQERWFARLYFLKPLTLGILSLYWIATGLIALGPGSAATAALVSQAGIGAARPVAMVAAAVDILVGIAIAVRGTARIALWSAIAISLAYALTGTVLLPELWVDPLGPFLKIAPIVMLSLVALAILDER